MNISDKQKQLLSLLSDGAFHSGTQLATTLGISRSAVWKQLNGLGQWGIHHAAVSGKGYRLDKPLELLAVAAINAALNPQTGDLISALDIHHQIDSTNRYLVEAAQHNAPSGSVCFAEYQTAGKGRRGRQWVSPYGSNIYLSILWRFQQGPASISGLSLAIGVAVIRALRQHQINGIGLKWPNDIYHQGKKLGGILVEVSGESDGPCSAVIGLGLNLFMPETDAENITQAWTDLSKITGHKQLSRNALAGILLNHLLSVIAEYERGGIQAYLDEWRGYDCLNGNAATLFIGQQQFEGIVRGIDDNGMLLLERTDGNVQTFASGEVSFSGLGA
ncbi:MAG: bifunctional biotin--[acetyl-CoA-carboxylase] ligase/biotin operon repressor BirA [Methylobacter sp.]|nr:bifunctional biotin--[acetyl-CoA-carboxylase] ligase/biotin operon repressor BirA [Methylobacter sp.]MDP2098449.1 bifunctional biotin--[acetyl-CoA-carboxylase] ligase/biotin operon repressor BirA [Methylobacter sp.]MDP2427156.1 bifunctional biotin--[acetyl-CoA-carboxylase] ligase/biotin operon repressor BirA [Methylobacter sp.]MDP3056664.1 bifunctional biotin--[acetyl-CoA-carboxylase] ligase/biotin operon repressor BirA [Methylobacter sp.]MDP3364237.1 bifunctional biotin--[acetyl-CoA-carboxy